MTGPTTTRPSWSTGDQVDRVGRSALHSRAARRLQRGSRRKRNRREAARRQDQGQSDHPRNGWADGRRGLRRSLSKDLVGVTDPER